MKNSLVNKIIKIAHIKMNKELVGTIKKIKLEKGRPQIVIGHKVLQLSLKI